jgi:uncharacterized membrane protein YsdA (DUF1294 family)
MQLTEALVLPVLAIIYILFVNLLAYAGMWWDKRKARKENWRVSEMTFFILSFVGGAIGIIAGMFKFRHKTQKRSFQGVVIIGLIVSLIIYWFIAIIWVSALVTV